jgi:transposase-like protein
MSKGKRYTEEFKSEAVKQITERGYSIAEVAERLGVNDKQLHRFSYSLSGLAAHFREVKCNPLLESSLTALSLMVVLTYVP